MAKFTKPPYELIVLAGPMDDWTGTRFVLRSLQAAPGGVAVMMGGLGEQEERANAQLFLAAPDLYDGCNALLGLIQLVCHRDDMPSQIKDALTSSYRLIEARRAVEKAEQT